ncbi:Protein of unknown function [Bacillus mycoides]
MRVLL